MNGIVITWPQLLYISLVLILFYAAELILFLRKSSQLKPQDPHLAEALVEQREKITELQREIDGLKVRLSTLLTQAHTETEALILSDEDSDDADSPYSHAIRLAQLGADANKVSQECGISRGEADLIVALYRTGTLH